MPANEPAANTSVELTRVVVIERDDMLRQALVDALLARGFAVTPVDSVEEATRWIESDTVDFVVTDLLSAITADAQLMQAIRKRRQVVPVVLTTGGHDTDMPARLRDATIDVLRVPYTEQELERAIERALALHLRQSDTLRILPYTHEHIEFVIPSRVEFLDGILNYLTERLIRMGIVHPHSSNIVIALDEAIVNAIKHGNAYDETKNVTIAADITCHEARFTVTDEGPGFRLDDVPDPCAPENLLRTSGRGLLLIRTIMDEMSLSANGNSLTMVKRAEESPGGGDAGCET